MKILIGTTNPAKFDRYKTILHELSDVEVVAPSDIRIAPPIVEDGPTAEANARKKARVYAMATTMPALSVDEALYVDAFPPEEQPGTNVRRYLGVRATDEELLAAFLAKIAPIPPDRRTVTWIYAICLALPDGREFFDQAELRELLIDRPSLPILPGYPLSSILFVPSMGKTQRDFTAEEAALFLKPVAQKVRGLVQAAFELQQAV